MPIGVLSSYYYCYICTLFLFLEGLRVNNFIS